MYNFYFYSPTKLGIVGFKENRFDEMMYWWMIVDTTQNANDILSDISSVQHVQRIKSMGFIGDWTYIQHAKASLYYRRRAKTYLITIFENDMIFYVIIF